MKTIPNWFMEMPTSEIDPVTVQRCVNELSSRYSAKYVRNIYALISSVVALVCPYLRIYATLPKQSHVEPYIPTDEDVRKILEKAQGTDYEIGIVLACYGARMSEICAITSDDVEGAIICLNKAVVRGIGGQWAIKHTMKTDASTRRIAVPIAIANAIKEKGYAYNGTPTLLTDWLYRTEKKLGIPKFSLHKLRHYFCSKAIAMGIDEATLLSLGGWSQGNTSVMRRVYKHSMTREDDAKIKIADRIANEILVANSWQNHGKIE